MISKTSNQSLKGWSSELEEREGGVYALLILSGNVEEITVGRLGGFTFAAGYYIYAGSAKRGLRGRIYRHTKREKSIRWHIDYLLKKAEIVGIFPFPTEEHLECSLNRIIPSVVDSYHPIAGFGSSDCSCTSHLHYCGSLLKKAGEEVSWGDIAGAIAKELTIRTKRLVKRNYKKIKKET